MHAAWPRARRSSLVIFERVIIRYSYFLKVFNSKFRIEEMLNENRIWEKKGGWNWCCFSKDAMDLGF
jgi:hypothetical protein